MTLAGLDPVMGVLLVPAIAAALLALLPGYRLPAQLNVVANYAAGISESAEGIQFSALGPVLEESMCKVRLMIEALVGCKLPD